ncbi:MAG: hypothetical protein PQJ59_03695 [Spirochaetales bacterium]|nr:hypothetical protein [Spirochaetales bacterium]
MERDSQLFFCEGAAGKGNFGGEETGAQSTGDMIQKKKRCPQAEVEAIHLSYFMYMLKYDFKEI